MIPASITSALTALQSQTTSAAPLSNATRATLVAIQLNADNLLASMDSAMPTVGGSLDTWVAPIDPPAIASGILGLLTNALDQSNLATMRGFSGRAAKNLDQLV